LSKKRHLAAKKYRRMIKPDTGVICARSFTYKRSHYYEFPAKKVAFHVTY